jgi:molybdenum cofactor cytidylyltransferase
MIQEPALFLPGVVVLAAGASSRMGQPKQLLAWRGKTILSHILGMWQMLPVQQIGVVYDPNQSAVSAELTRLGFSSESLISNPEVEKGMFGSVQAAARWTGWMKDLTHYVIALGDQPQLQSELLGGLIGFARANPRNICQPSYQGRGRHPVVLPKTLFHSLAGSSAQTLKDFLRPFAEQVRLFECEHEALNFDIDTPADYQQVLKLFTE